MCEFVNESLPWVRGVLRWNQLNKLVKQVLDKNGTLAEAVSLAQENGIPEQGVKNEWDRQVASRQFWADKEEIIRIAKTAPSYQAALDLLEKKTFYMPPDKVIEQFNWAWRAENRTTVTIAG